MGAIRPPWVTKEDFYRTPFNYCDRWCERCQLTKICKAYQESERDRKRALREGNDPDSWEFTFEAMHKNFTKTMKLIKKGCKKWGIDWEEVTKFDEKEFTDYMREKDKLQKDALYHFSIKWSDHIGNFLKKFTDVPIETPLIKVLEAQDVLSWYVSLIPAKVYRALSSEQSKKGRSEEPCSYDDKTSAFIAYNGLVKVSEALVRLALEKSLRLIHKKCVLLSKESLDLARLLAKRFYFEVKESTQN